MRAGLLLLASALLQAQLACAETRLVTNVIKGVVVESGTGKPIANAVVSAKWYGGWSSALGGGTVCTKGAAALTDETGRFQFPASVYSHSDVVAFIAELMPYKAGYQDIQRGYAEGIRKKTLGLFPASEFEIPATDLRIEVKAFAGSELDRAEYLRRFLSATWCRESADVVSMGLLYRAMRDEIGRMPPPARDSKDSLSRRSLPQVIEDFIRRTDNPRATSQIDYPK